MSGCIPPDKKKYFFRKQVSVILHGCVSVYWIEMSNVFLTVAHWFKKSEKCCFRQCALWATSARCTHGVFKKLPGLLLPQMHRIRICGDRAWVCLVNRLPRDSNEVKETSPGKDLERASLPNYNYSRPCRGFHFWRGSGLWLCCRLAESGRCEGSRLSIREAAFQGVALTWGQNAQVPTLALSPTSSITLTKVI